MKKLLSIVLAMVVILSFGITANALESNNVQVVTNGDTTFIIESNGTVKGWGRNDHGAVGNGATAVQNVPVQIQGLSNIRAIVTDDYGYGHFFAIDHSGSVYSWGYNGYGLLGLGHSSAQNQPARIEGLPPVSQIVLSGYTTYAITVDGDVYAWGKNDYGQIGNNTKTNQIMPYKIVLPKVTDLICKTGVTFALTESKDVYAWGRGDGFQMGNGDYLITQMLPIKIDGLSNVDEVITSTLSIDLLHFWQSSPSSTGGVIFFPAPVAENCYPISDIVVTACLHPLPNRMTYSGKIFRCPSGVSVPPCRYASVSQVVYACAQSFLS